MPETQTETNTPAPADGIPLARPVVPAVDEKASTLNRIVETTPEVVRNAIREVVANGTPEQVSRLISGISAAAVGERNRLVQSAVATLKSLAPEHLNPSAATGVRAVAKE